MPPALIDERLIESGSDNFGLIILQVFYTLLRFATQDDYGECTLILAPLNEHSKLNKNPFGATCAL